MTRFCYLIEAWQLEEKDSKSAGMYWKGRAPIRPRGHENAIETVTKDPFEALHVDQPNVAEQLAGLLNDLEPVSIYGVKGRWNVILHGFEEPLGENTRGRHVPYPDEKQIVEHLASALDEHDRGKLIEMGDADDLAMIHHGFGTWVRNTYNLWHAENPHTLKGYEPELKDGVDYSPRHPDAVSGRIIEALYKKLKEQPHG